MKEPIGKAFSLAEAVPYSDGKIVNKDLFHNEKMKFVVMAFDAGTGLSEHAAPGEAMVFALDGEGVIGYEGQEHTLHAGETFCFAKGGKHFVKAKQARFSPPSTMLFRAFPAQRSKVERRFLYMSARSILNFYLNRHNEQ